MPHPSWRDAPKIEHAKPVSRVIRACAAEQVERFVWQLNGAFVIGYRQRWSMHSVENWWLNWVATQESDDAYLHVVFGSSAHVHVSELSQHQDVSDGMEGGSVLLSPTGSDWGTRIPLMLRVHHAGDDEDDPLTEALRGTAAEVQPRGKCLYRVAGEDLDATDGRWLAVGVRPRDEADTSPEILRRLDAFYAKPWSVYAKRIGAQALSANASGSQRYGVSFSGALFSMLPLDAYRWLRHACEDELLRPVTWLECDGWPMRAGQHPDMLTLNRRIDWRLSKDKFGLVLPPPRVTRYSCRTADDSQHTDDLGMSAMIALFDDPDIDECRAGIVEIDALVSRMRRNQANTASRGIGRPMLSIANAAWLLRGAESGRVATLTALWCVKNVLETWNGKAVLERDPLAPIRPARIHRPDPRITVRDPRTGEPAWWAMPYEEASVVVGLIAAAEVLEEPDRQVALNLAKMIAETVLWWHYEEGGRWRAPYAIAVLTGDELGTMLPQAWRTPGSPEFAASHATGGSWTRWSASAAFAVPYLEAAVGPFPEELRQRARRIREVGEPDVRKLDEWSRLASMAGSVPVGSPSSSSPSAVHGRRSPGSTPGLVFRRVVRHPPLPAVSSSSGRWPQKASRAKHCGWGRLLRRERWRHCFGDVAGPRFMRNSSLIAR